MKGIIISWASLIQAIKRTAAARARRSRMPWPDFNSGFVANISVSIKAIKITPHLTPKIRLK
jgi:hypothetical protein